MKAINMINIYRKYKGQWVAINNLEDRRVVAHGQTLKKVLGEANKKGFKAPIVTQIPKEILPIIGSPQIVR